jgi:hypothetical protein
MAGGRGLKREGGAKRGGEENWATGKWRAAGKGAKRGGEEKGATGGGTAAGKGGKSGSDAAADSDVEDGVTFTRPPPPAAQVEVSVLTDPTLPIPVVNSNLMYKYK